jgi:hypothetical protein
MKVIFELDDQTDGRGLIHMTLKGPDAFVLLHEMDQNIRSLLKYDDVDVTSAEEEKLNDYFKADTLEQAIEKNRKLIKLLTDIRKQIWELTQQIEG